MTLFIYFVGFVLVGGTSSVLAAVGSRAALRHHRLPSWWIAIAACVATAVLVVIIGCIADLSVPGTTQKGNNPYDPFWLDAARYLLPRALVLGIVPSLLVVFRYRKLIAHANAA